MFQGTEFLFIEAHGLKRLSGVLDTHVFRFTFTVSELFVFLRVESEHGKGNDYRTRIMVE